MKMVVQLTLAFVILFALFALLQLIRPRDRHLPLFRRGFWTDAAYWLFTPVVTRSMTQIALVVALAPIAILIYGKLDANLVRHGYGPAARLPLWLQAAAILLISDFFSYWMHRAFHRGRLWRFHAVHHSSVDLDWLSSVRQHPVNDAVMRIVTALPVVVLGFSPVAVLGLLPLITFMAILVHANVDWDWGPLRWLVASPCFHRWHHSDEPAARDKNFAGLFPFWDLLFGTYYMPRDRRPSGFGTQTPVPSGLVGQLVFPFRKSA